MLNSSCESGYPCLVPDFGRNALNFLPLKIMFSIGLPYMAFIVLRYVPSLPTFWRVFIINRCWILSKAFSASLEIITFLIFQFVNMVHDIDWFVNFEESLHPWNRAHLVMMYNLCNMLLESVCYNFVEYFCICVHQWYWPVVFLFCGIFGFGIRVASLNAFGSFPSAIFWNSLSRISVSTSLYFWHNSPVKLSGPARLLEDFLLQFWFPPLWLICSNFLFIPGSVLKGYTFLRICPFLPSCTFYWHMATHSSLMIVCVVCCHLLEEIGSFLLLYKFQVYNIVTQIF